jgi:hypothetical protein
MLPEHWYDDAGPPDGVDGDSGWVRRRRCGRRSRCRSWLVSGLPGNVSILVQVPVAGGGPERPSRMAVVLHAW